MDEQWVQSKLCNTSDEELASFDPALDAAICSGMRNIDHDNI